MPPLTNRSHQALLNSTFGKTSNFGVLATAPAVWVALSTTLPTMAGANFTPPVGQGYARVATVAADWVAATSADPSVLENATDVEFPTVAAAGDWGVVTHFGIYDDETAGNLLGFGVLAVPKNPTDGDTPRFAAGQLTVEIGAPA